VKTRAFGMTPQEHIKRKTKTLSDVQLIPTALLSAC